MSDLPIWDENAHAARLRARRRRATEARSAWKRTLRRRGALVFVSVMGLSVGGAVAHSTGGAPAKAAKKWDRGASVAAIQRALGIPADGIFGPQTRRAVRRFQRREGLAVDGVAGPATLRALGLRPRTTRRAAAPNHVLRRIALCESGGNPRAISPDGRYRGKYQFSRATWRRLGGKGDPAKAPEAVQDRIAARLLAREGTSPWPACSARL